MHDCGDKKKPPKKPKPIIRRKHGEPKNAYYRSTKKQANYRTILTRLLAESSHKIYKFLSSLSQPPRALRRNARPLDGYKHSTLCPENINKARTNGETTGKRTKQAKR